MSEEAVRAAILEERAKCVAHIRANADVNRRNAERYAKGRDRHEMLSHFVDTGDKRALEAYRQWYIAESFTATADAIEDGLHEQIFDDS